MYVSTHHSVNKRSLISLPLRPALLDTVAPPQSLGQAFVCSVSRRVSWKLTEAATWNTRDTWLDISSPRCLVDSQSPTMATSPSTYVTFVSLSFGTDADSCKELNYIEIPLWVSSQISIPQMQNKTSNYKYYSTVLLHCYTRCICVIWKGMWQTCMEFYLYIYIILYILYI